MMDQFTIRCRELWREIKTLSANVSDLHAHDELAEVALNAEEVSEVHANVMLSFRHLEDAAMRLGKAIQAADGGVSVYDKEEA